MTSRAIAFLLGMALAANVVRADDAADAPLTPNDFAYGMRVPSPGDAAAYRVALPLAVYQKVLRGDLGDVRMFNERDELVPYRIERPNAQEAVQVDAVSLPVFKLRDSSRRSLDAVRVTIEAGGARVGVQTPDTGATTARVGSKDDAAPALASYVLDGRALESPVSMFELSWPDDAPDFAGRLRVEASDDLGTWRTVVTGAPIANLRAGEARVVERRVDLAGVGAKFWRLSWADTPAPFEITAVKAEPTRDHVDVPRQTLSVPGTSAKPGEFEFDLGARVPADRVNLELPEQNSIIEAELLSRASPTQAWRHVARGGFYRLKATRPVPTGDSKTVEADADLTNGSITIEPNTDRYWLARVAMDNGGLGRGAPRLRVGWIADNVVFLARGNGPFTLAYGSSKARPTTALGAIPATVSVVHAELSAPVTLGGDARLQPEPPGPFWTKSVILWTVLGVGVALLAFMAYRLSRELKK